jgi:hypothetical protein
MDVFSTSLAEILGIDSEYDMFNKQAKVCNIKEIIELVKYWHL